MNVVENSNDISVMGKATILYIKSRYFLKFLDLGWQIPRFLQIQDWDWIAINQYHLKNGEHFRNKTI